MTIVSRLVDGQLSCRVCGESKAGWRVMGKGVTSQMRAVRINKVRERENKCKDVRKGSKGSECDGCDVKRSKVSKVADRIAAKDKIC